MTEKELSPTRLLEIVLDEATIGRGDPKVNHEREVAIYDILDDSHFVVRGHEASGPYRLKLSLVEDKLNFDVSDEAGTRLVTRPLALAPFKRILKDYFLVLDSYFKAVTAGQPSKIEAIDMGRRGLHDEGSELLKERLSSDFEIDFDTARRLFTLLSALSWKG